MKTASYYLILAIAIGTLCAPALGEVEFPQSEQRGLIGQANPTLAGIENLLVIIEPPDAEPNKDGLVWKELEAKIINKLNEAGIKIMPGIAGSILNIDELRVYIDMLKLTDSQQYVFCIQTSLARAVYLKKQRHLLFKADVWKVEPVMQAVSVKDMPTAVTNVTLEQAEAFIHTYLAANPPDKQPSDTNDISTVPKERLKPVAKSTAAKYEYVASKNSKVFHKPDCSSARRIKPENLTDYNSRAGAIKAGKRPCKRCKP